MRLEGRCGKMPIVKSESGDVRPLLQYMYCDGGGNTSIGNLGRVSDWVVHRISAKGITEREPDDSEPSIQGCCRILGSCISISTPYIGLVLLLATGRIAQANGRRR